MTSSTFKYTSYAISILEKIIGSDFVITGLENIPKGQPIMFVANHFTRSETFFVPYLISKHADIQARTLADSSLYQGFLGRFLMRVGTISTKDVKRDQKIVKDLVENNYSWLIYPEGSMVKSKKIEKKELYISHTPYRTGPVRTGSAVLALKSHLFRQDLIEAHQSDNQALLDYYKKEYDISYSDELKNIKTYVVPLSITYYPIRPGQNRLELFAKKRIEKISPRIVEELQIEGNLLQMAQINLHFGKPVELGQYTKITRDLVYQIPIIQNETKNNFVIRYFKNRLTNDFMKEVYCNIKINLDHLFSAALRHINEPEISIIDLKRIIYLSAILIRKSGKFIINKSIKEENLFKIFCDENHHEFCSIFNLAKELGEIIQLDENRIKINKKALFADYDFHQARLQNTLQVIYNEFSLLENAVNIVKRNCKMPTNLPLNIGANPSEEMAKKCAQEILKYDVLNYELDYHKYFDAKFSKKKEVGMPYALHPQKLRKTQKKIGVIVCHGYKSSPAEVRALGEFLQDQGYYIYAPRLKGHGTAPINLQDVTYCDWLDSVDCGYAYLKNYCEEIAYVGFSTGGLLSLYAASKKQARIGAIVSINAALRLQDVRAKFVPMINVWNDLLHKLDFKKGYFEYVDDTPENPDFNYSRNYLKGVEELEKLMHCCENSLPKITTPTLTIQAKQDPVVNPISAHLIQEKISSKIKELYEVDFDNHVIINNSGKEVVFAMIANFLKKIL